MKVSVHKQKPSARKVAISGRLALHDGVAILIGEGDLCLTELHKPEIVFINQEGLMLRGFEKNGYTVSGQQKYLYQEWFCRYEVG